VDELYISEAHRLHRWYLHKLCWIGLRATVRIAQYCVFYGSFERCPAIWVAVNGSLISLHRLLIGLSNEQKASECGSPGSTTCIVEVGTDVVGETVLGASRTPSVFHFHDTHDVRIRFSLYVSNRPARATSTASGSDQLGFMWSQEQPPCTVRYNCSCSLRRSRLASSHQARLLAWASLTFRG